MAGDVSAPYDGGKEEHEGEEEELQFGIAVEVEKHARVMVGAAFVEDVEEGAEGEEGEGVGEVVEFEHCVEKLGFGYLGCSRGSEVWQSVKEAIYTTMSSIRLNKGPI